MEIQIFKGMSITGEPVAIFGKPNVDVLTGLFEMADAALDIEVIADLDRIDKQVPLTCVGTVRVHQTDEQDVFYELHIKEETVNKPATGRKPSAAAGASVIQSVLFDRSMFSLEQARAWIKSHDGVGDYGVEETEGNYRFRQYDPAHFVADRFRTADLTDGVKAIFGVVKGDVETDESADEAEMDKAIQETKTRVAVRELNKAISERGLTLIPGSAEMRKAADGGTEERFVLSMVLEPNDGESAPLKPDTQDDIYSADEIRKTAHNWMEKHGHVDLEHNWSALGKSDVAVLESYIAPADFAIGEAKVAKGSWMLGLRIKNDALWKAVQAGEIGAYSVGGYAERVPVEVEE